jgi:hypothetical protein
MEMKPHVRLRPLIRSPQWNVLKGYLEERVENLRAQLENCDTEDLKKIQGSVQELKSLLGIEDQLKTSTLFHWLPAVQTIA